MSKIEDAARNLADALELGRTGDDIAERLTCGEVNLLADLFRALDMPEAADGWLREHARQDDEGDEHYTGERSCCGTLATEPHKGLCPDPA